MLIVTGVFLGSFTSDLSNFLSLDQAGQLLHTFGTRLHDPPASVCRLGSVTRASDKFDKDSKQLYDSSYALALDTHDQHVVLGRLWLWAVQFWHWHVIHPQGLTTGCVQLWKGTQPVPCWWG